MTYRDPVLGRLDHTDDPDFDDPERPTADDLAGLVPRPVPDEQRFTRVHDPASGFAWQVSRDQAHRMARAARHQQNNAARSDSYSGRAA